MSIKDCPVLIHTRFCPPQGSVVDQSGEETMTRQSEADSVDINKIMERFNRSGKLPAMQSLPPRYGDARVVDYQTALQLVKDAEDQFMQLPALTRKEYANSPQNFLEAVSEAVREPSGDVAKKLLKQGVLVKKEATASDLLNGIYENTKKSVAEKGGNSDPT